MTDYRRAFKIACELINGAVLYGYDIDKIFEILMDEGGIVTSESYEDYILNHLDELDHGQYKESEDEQWCNTCEYKDLEAECHGCAEYDKHGNLIGLRHYKRESEA